MTEARTVSGERPAVSKTQTGGHAKVVIAIDDASDHTFWADLTMEVDKGGVFVATYQPLPLGAVVDLEMTLPDGGEPVPASGVVRWTRPHLEGSDGVAGVGVKFVELSAEAKERVARFAEARQPMMYDLEDAPIRKRRRSAA
jgi:uncharacterized protein (TIGR02266 family)